MIEILSGVDSVSIQKEEAPIDTEAAKTDPGKINGIIETVFQRHFHGSPLFAGNVMIFNALRAFVDDLEARIAKGE